MPGAATIDNNPAFPGAIVAETTFAINNQGDTAGVYTDRLGDDGTSPPDSTHGFTRSRHGRVTSFDVRGAAQVLVKGNNSRGQVVGEYIDRGAEPEPDGLLPPPSVHGFARDRVGRITRFDLPSRYLHDIGDQ